jgi:hypothetical protein
LERGQGFVKVGFSKTPDVQMHGMCFVIFQYANDFFFT